MNYAAAAEHRGFAVSTSDFVARLKADVSLDGLSLALIFVNLDLHQGQRGEKPPPLPYFMHVASTFNTFW